MIDVVSSGGIGNKIKNLVSALRLADIKNDIVNFPYYDGIIDYYTPPPNHVNSNSFVYTTWKLETYQTDINNGVLINPDKMIVLEDGIGYNTIVKNEIDFQYNNIQHWMRSEYLKYFDQIYFSQDILDAVEKFLYGVDINKLIGISIRAWVEHPFRHNTLFDGIESYMQIMDKYKDCTFFVCSDSKMIIDQLKTHYSNIIHLPSTIENRHEYIDTSSEFIKNAMCEMLILSKCKSLIGSYMSTFIECAWWFGGANQPIEIQTPKFILNLMGEN